MKGKRVIFTKHASERLLERGIPIRTIFAMLQKGIRIADRETGAVLYVYKQKGSKFHTLVADETDTQITIITSYESSIWQIANYKKVKKDGRAKMQ